MMEDLTGASEAPQAQATPPPNPYSQPLAAPCAQDADENEDEWDYEYSTTETETYYVTLDLTTPVNPASYKAPLDESERKIARWANPNFGRLNGLNRVAYDTEAYKNAPVFTVKDHEDGTAATAPTDTQETDGNPNADNEDQVEKPDEVTPEPEDSQPLQNPARRATEVQILDLDTDSPMVLYDGHVFSCQWASNIGTEMLFMKRDLNCDLPILRELPDKVDLLAASSARIISKSIQLKPKIDEVINEVYQPGNPVPRDQLLKPGNQASVGRKQQAAFLSRLIEIKERRGEQDMVTVNVKRRYSQKQWRDEYRASRKEEMDHLKKMIMTSKNKDEVQFAKERIEEMIREHEEKGFDIDATEPPEKPPRKKPNVNNPKGAAARGLDPGRPAKPRRAVGAKGPKGDMPQNMKKRGRKPKIAVRFDVGGSARSSADAEGSRQDSQSMGGTPRAENMTPGSFEDNDGCGNGDGYETMDGQTPRDDEWSPSQQVFDDDELHDEDAPGEEDDG